MENQNVRLIDKNGAVVAHARVAAEGSHFGGDIDLRSVPHNLRSLFDEFEEIVNGQMFACLDQVQKKIGAFAIRAAFDDGSISEIDNLQVFPETGDVSFEVRGTTLSTPMLEKIGVTTADSVEIQGR